MKNRNWRPVRTLSLALSVVAIGLIAPASTAFAENGDRTPTGGVDEPSTGARLTSVRRITLIANGDGRILAGDTVELPRGITFYGPLSHRAGELVREPLVVERVPSALLPKPKPLAAEAERLLSQLADRRQARGAARQALDVPADCYGPCDFILDVYYPSGASSTFVYARYRFDEPGGEADESAGIVYFTQAEGRPYLSVENAAGAIPDADFGTGYPDDSCASFVRDPNPSENGLAMSWFGKYLPGQLDSTIYLGSYGTMPQEGCPPWLWMWCVPEVEGVSFLINLHPQ